MTDVSLRFLEKREFEAYGERMFSLLYENMHGIQEFRKSYDEEKADWLRLYGGAFRGREERMIVVIEDPDRQIKGFFGYCADGDTFVMEEIQFSPDIRGRDGIFRRLYGFVLEHLPPQVRWVEASAHRNNEKSRGILKWLGLDLADCDLQDSILTYRGSFSDLLSWYNTSERK